jgi:hydroxymethylglutaryl-CoA lyase
MDEDVSIVFKAGGYVTQTTPDAATLVEVGPRDGFQFEKTVVPTQRKLAVIARLIESGLKQIQVASFVHPAKLPQMADADELVAALPPVDDVTYSALVLNQRGLDRALDSGIGAVEISLSASDTHSRKNAGMGQADALEAGLTMIDRALSAGLTVRASIQCAFGCVDEGSISLGRIFGIIEGFVDHGAHVVSLADTTGMGTPPLIRDVLDAILPLTGGLPVALHLHDTRGLGLVNLMTALNHGISIFDTALGGMGGCPFVSGAAGNIATEDTIHLLDSLCIQTGVDHRIVGAVSRDLEAFFNTSFPGRMHRLTAPPC